MTERGHSASPASLSGKDTVVTFLEHELGEMPNDTLRRFAASGVPSTAKAAQAELDSRPSTKANDTEAWIRAPFLQHP